MESGFFLDVVVTERASIFELLACKDEALLIWWNTLFILNLRLDIVNRVGGLDLKGDRLAGEGLDKDLHATAETKHQVQCGFFLNVVIGERSAVLELFAGEDQTLLVWWDTFLVLDLRLDVIDGIG